MNLGILFRLLLCVAVMGGLLYAYITEQNTITQLRLYIPSLSKELQAIEQENTRLQFEIDQFENPTHLMEWARRPEFRHLKHPLVDEIITIPREEKK